MLAILLLLVSSGASAQETPPPAAHEDDLVAIYSAAIDHLLPSSHLDLFVGIGPRRSELVDPPPQVFVGKPDHVYPYSKVVEVSLRDGVKSSVSLDPGELIYFDILRADSHRAYMLVHTFRRRLNSSMSMYTLIRLEPGKWIVAVECPITVS